MSTSSDLIDSQFNAENVCFDFDKTFFSPISVATARDYLYYECNDKHSKKKSKLNDTLSKTSILDSSLCVNNTILKSQPLSCANKNLKNWGLPAEIAKKYEQNGIKEMFDWQVKCLSNTKVLFEGKNLVYSAPTSAGKTLVAEILTIKTVLERRKKVIIILPFVSIVREKTFYLQDILSTSGIRVEGFMGSQSPSGGLQAVHVAVCTIEKANSLINKLLDEGNTSVLGAVIVDELHLLGDPGRGYILELLLTKIRYISTKFDDVNIQIVGMSATLPNLSELASWLEAELYITDFRPIPLEEFCLIEDKLYNNKCELVKAVKGAQILAGESDLILTMCLETIEDGCSVLLFCMTKNRCESLALRIASTFRRIGTLNVNQKGNMLRTQLNTDNISEVLQQLRNCPVGLDPVMTQTISFGVAYHHAGLSYEERDIIEGAFKSGAIRVLVATSTLSSGVNLPARKVIIRSPVFQRELISNMTYKQMVGRAGRMGKDSKGESVLMCSYSEKKLGFQLLKASLDPVRSCLDCEDKYMRAILEIIASEAACTLDELNLYAQCTLASCQNKNFAKADSPASYSVLESTLRELINYELVRIQLNEGKDSYVATSLGKACLSSSMGPIDALTLFCELEKARKCLVLDSDLHLIYLVTPFSVSSQWGNNIDWLYLLNQWESLSVSNKRVAQLVGVEEKYLVCSVRGKRIPDTDLNIQKRFYTALALQDLVNEVPLSEVAKNFQCSRGFLQSLQQGAATFAGMVTAFCHQLGWRNMEILISQFQDRLNFGIHSELIELMKLPSLNGARARCLFDKGFETVADVASADINILENVLHRSIPFQSEKGKDEEVRNRQTKNIWITGCRGMTVKELAEKLVLEARKYLEYELGILDAKWIKKSDTNESLKTSYADVSYLRQETEVNKSSHKTNEESNDISSVRDVVDECQLAYNENHDLMENSKQNLKTPQKTLQEIKKNTKIHTGLNIHDNSMQLDVKKLSYNNTASNKCRQTSVVEDEVVRESVELRETDIENVPASNKSRHTSEIEHEVVWDSIELRETDIENVLASSKSRQISVIKDEVVWDSIELRETDIQNVTKNPTPNKLYSPNVSFGDTEDTITFQENAKKSANKSLKSVSFKDISLFSSDFDDSSLFEESLPLELIPSKLLDGNDKSSHTNLCNPVNSATNGFSINSNTLLKEFNSTEVEADDDQNMKLVYEDDKQSPINDFSCFNESNEDLNQPQSLLNDPNHQSQKKVKTTDYSEKIKKPLKIAENNSEQSSLEIEDVSKSSFNESFENTEEPLIKKLKKIEKPSKVIRKKRKRPFKNLVKQKSETIIINSNDTSLPFVLKDLNSAIISRNINDTKFKVAILCGCDVEYNIDYLYRYVNVNMYLRTKQSKTLTQTEDAIGGKILKQKKKKYDSNKVFEFLSGLALYCGKDICVYLDLDSVTESYELVKTKISDWLQNLQCCRFLSLKTDYLCLKKCFDLDISGTVEDVFFTEWLINRVDILPNLQTLIKNYLVDVSTDLCDTNEFEKILTTDSIQSAVFKAWCIWAIMEKQKRTLIYKSLKRIVGIENQVAKILAECEYYGIAVDKELSSQLLTDVKQSMMQLESHSHKILRRALNFNSSRDVAQALGLVYSNKKTVSTKKAVLTAHKSPLASIVIYWRKLNAILTHILYPLTENVVIRSKSEAVDGVRRISPRYTMYTSTGRISMEQPNLQNVPRPFSIPLTYLSGDPGEITFNCRRAIRAMPGCVLVAADYCQLEMRILTHYSKDKRLMQVMKSGEDVFKSVAAEWGNVPEYKVDDDLRQRAKQICYGVIYGMGAKALSQQLDVTEVEAAEFAESFHQTFPGIRTFTDKVVAQCRERGYVETLKNRRRYLADIVSHMPARRSAAERKAVNTTIQGSAADIAKAAMCAVYESARANHLAARLVLQLHDELIYEVPQNEEEEFAKILKRDMENTISLTVPLPVKVKVGDTWGTLRDVFLT